MKLVIVVPDGMCDIRYPDLGYLSPVEYAHTPGIDRIAQSGQAGLVRTMYDGLPLGSLVGFLGMLGYDPKQYAPLGRSLFEAHALGLKLEPSDLAFRCNIVRVSRDARLIDFTAGQLDEFSANRYLAGLELPPHFEIHHDQSYRNVLIHRDCPWSLTSLKLFEPHENVGNDIMAVMPRYRDRLHEPMVDLILASRRNGLMLWPWAASRVRSFPRLPFGLCVVTALSFLYGLTEILGGTAVAPEGATGYLGSDLGAKFSALAQHLAEVDVAIVHCNAPDEEAHSRNLQGKIQAIEDIDRLVIRPLLNYLEDSVEHYRLVICPDHYTCCHDGKHHGDPVPYVVMGQDIQSSQGISNYSEAAITRCADQTLESHQLIASLRP